MAARFIDRKTHPRTTSRRALTVLGLVCLIAALWHGFPLHRNSHAQAAPRPVQPRSDLSADETRTIDVFENASPAVTYITTTAMRRDFFSMNVFEIPQGTGSGFVWDKQGHVVTNFHVIQNAQRAQVTLADHSTWPATLVGTAPDKDLAILKIQAPADKLHCLPVGASHDLRVGQKVLAIGNPFGLDQTLTTGVISGLGREIQSVTRRPIQDVIQTDAAINPGNSGGPLLDSAGRLIGINTAIYSPSGAYAGVGFAVPVDTVNRVVPQLIAHGRLQRAGLGVRIAQDQLAKRLGFEGVLVLEVVSGGGAARAGMQGTRRTETGGLRLGDVITRLDDKPVRNTNDLLGFLDRHTVGQTVDVRIVRRKETLTLKVKLGAID